MLSSSTVFMFSIQTASTGPSNRIHLRVSVKFDAYSRNVFASTPSFTSTCKHTHTHSLFRLHCLHRLHTLHFHLTGLFFRRYSRLGRSPKVKSKLLQTVVVDFLQAGCPYRRPTHSIKAQTNRQLYCLSDLKITSSLFLVLCFN